MKLQSDLRDSARSDGVQASLRRVLPLGGGAPTWARRTAFVAPVVLLPALGLLLAAVATEDAASWLRLPLLALLFANLFYLGLTSWPGVLGFVVRSLGGAVQVAARPSGLSRTALVMPIYNENPRAVFTAVEAMARSVADAGLRGVDVFVLSDTRDPAIAVAEEVGFAALRARAPAGPKLHYRRREVTARRKVGNIAEFCEGEGAAYDYMVVLDADSLMSAQAVGTLIGVMDANPRAGMVQSVPQPVGRRTLFARIQQVAAQLYTPMLVEGQLFWQNNEGNYWGHNAIVRIAPFVAHCDLPVLPGREPFGGEILCHDVVEAGLMRAAGWDVWVLPQAMDSYEALPANMIDFANRERRWCQGNLQHIGLLARPGPRAMGRFHLAYGVMHYIAGLLVVGFMALATLDAVLDGGFAAALLPSSGPAAAGVVAITLFALYSAKVTALIGALVNPAEAASFGGRGRLLASAALEQLAAFVVSPVLMVSYTQYIWALLRGGSVRWDAQPRDDRGLTWREGWLRLRSHTLTGAAWLALLLATETALLLWSMPLLAGLLLAVPAAILSSRATLGGAARRLGLFLTPDETAPPPILRAYNRLMQPAEGERIRPAPSALQLTAVAESD